MSKKQTVESTDKSSKGKSSRDNSAKDESNKNKQVKVKDNNEDSGPNKATTAAGLTFNVNSFRNWMKDQFADKNQVINDEKEEKKKPSKNDENKDGENDKVKDKTRDRELPKFNGGHIALTAAVEDMIKIIFTACESYMPKDKAGLFELNKEALISACNINDDMKKMFKSYLEYYDVNENYTTNYVISKDKFAAFIDKHFGKNIKLTMEGYNLLVFFLNKFAINVVKISKELLDYSGKRSIKDKTIISCVRLICTEAVSERISRRIQDSCKQIVNDDEKSSKDTKKNKKDNKNDDSKKKKKQRDEDENEDDEDDENDKKKVRKQKDKDEDEDEEGETDNKKVRKQKQKHDDDESDDDSGDDSDNDSDNDSDDE